ncbi:Biotin-requiring enzyme [Aeromicrobium marinum DSM 15272]|uniref:Biotin-requiring enzyme n=1 Tax=Aeromicrobium marinum DSM 15272 TaxID=585531 RepID=E2S815_9ACTN|nr:acetyl-CoA carboxylase biotin carboxyl carrier protein subunit [Aeromicrobium marinum]EFQ84831.1 Biotin-requiring enzyme [Aeromicrobium marinum DSM 15272]
MEIDVRSEVAGTVTHVGTTVGSEVAAHASLVFVEAMKMDIPVPAPAAGTVSAVHVAVGDQVAENQVVAVVTTAS